MTIRKFSEAEVNAIEAAKDGLLSSAVSDTTTEDVFGNPVPGWRVFRKLEREGYLFETEEDPIEINGEPFTFTTVVCLTDLGEAALKLFRAGCFEMNLDPAEAPDP
ncbi:hypothetical protein LAZ40_11360 [Cereibacter sphaeroides]|uniref:hypothetical protein n=1 Tax=Cereibacter sphaeroides TaxID=1063 RepID=UPI001F456483|nr:hypothetical protein [Cereibacter sphaeroides]MCE6959628.1 hypothetical protein [Cereibacter sphaeroides]MCE6974511.1 hypothetical protein [Cereibacter sphaeroides]